MYPGIYIKDVFINIWDICLYVSMVLIPVLVVLFKPRDFPIKRGQIFWAAVLFLVFGLLGANFLNIIINSPQHKGQDLQEILLTSGIAYLGLPVIGFLVLGIFCKVKKVSFLACADYAAPFLMLERVIGRIGCLMQGCCHGIESHLPWAHYFLDDLPRHPTQGYEIAYACAIFISGIYLYKKAKQAKGITFFYTVLSYSVFRFINEFLRAEGPFIYKAIKYSHTALFVFAVIAILNLAIITKSSSLKEQISKFLKSAFIQLLILFFSFGVLALLILSIIPKDV